MEWPASYQRITIPWVNHFIESRLPIRVHPLFNLPLNCMETAEEDRNIPVLSTAAGQSASCARTSSHILTVNRSFMP